MTEVSVIIPVYNRPSLLAEAADSVLNQSFSDLELIIVDDGSTDDTFKTAGRIAASAGGRCRLIRTSHAGMPGAARNRGIEAAAGRYIAFLDSDDHWAPLKLEKQISLMKSTGAKLSHTLETWNRGGRIVSQKGQKHRREGDVFTDALKKCTIGPSTVMIEREFCRQTGGFRENLEIAEDYEYWLRITPNLDVAYLNEALTVKRAGNWTQLSEKYGKIEWFRLTALAGLLDIDLPGATNEASYLEGYIWSGFHGANLDAALDEFLFKCGVWAAGCRKRGRISEAERVDEIVKSIGRTQCRER